MKKLAYVLAAIGAIALAVPSMATTANAETVIIKRGGHHHHHGARAHVRSDRGITVAGDIVMPARWWSSRSAIITTTIERDIKNGPARGHFSCWLVPKPEPQL